MRRSEWIGLLLVFTIPGVVLHAQSSIFNSKHDLSVSSTGATIKAETEDEVCVFCHTPHSAAIYNQLWNREAAGAPSYTLYTSSRLTAAGYPTPSQPGEKSQLCMSCHDGTIALGSVYNIPGAGLAGTITMASDVTTMPTDAPGYIGTDLTDDHPVGYEYDPTSDPDLITRAWPWPGPVMLDPNNASGTVECYTCHNVHDNSNQPFLHLPEADLCIECHSKTGWSESKHYISVGCAGCHKPHGGGNALLSDIEEVTCYTAGCHGITSPVTGSSGRSLDIQTQLNYTSAHPTHLYSGIHTSGEVGEPDSLSATYSKRHAECFDCHDPHQAGGSTSGIATALKGVWGVEPTYIIGDIPNNTVDNENGFAIPSSYTVANPVTDEYQVCLKCHSDYTTPPAGRRNIAEEINPYYISTHGLYLRTVKDGSDGTEPRNPFVNVNSMNPPFNEDPSSYTRDVLCSDCHANDLAGATLQTRTDAKGAHGSSITYTSPDPYSNSTAMLVATIASDAVNGTPLCHVCHSRSNYWDGTLVSSRCSEHPSAKAKHKLAMGCFSCHMYDYSYYPIDTGGGSERIFVHGQEKRYNVRELSGFTAGTGQLLDAFVNGYMADMDFVGTQCWSEVSVTNCGKGHVGQGYSSVGP
ncbi:cytochrome c3 family protein [Candidatus Neomarinimicrobiota bacterium]